jgi:hypothetical protein
MPQTWAVNVHMRLNFLFVLEYGLGFLRNVYLNGFPCELLHASPCPLREGLQLRVNFNLKSRCHSDELRVCCHGRRIILVIILSRQQSRC